MTRGRSGDNLTPFDPEIERTLRKNLYKAAPAIFLGEVNNQEEMADGNQNGGEVEQPRTMFDYARPSLDGTQSSIARPTVAANTFEIKPNIIQMVQQNVQFHGLPDEDPNAHLASFLEVCDTFKINGVTEDAIRLRLFPFSLKDRAKQWLTSLPAGSITTWQGLAEKFLSKYFPPSKTAKFRNDISSFSQHDMESLYETWERFRDLLRKCPHHGLPTWLQVQTFYNGLNGATRQTIDAAAGGSLNSKTPEAALDIIDEMAMNSYQWQSSRARGKQSGGIHQVDQVTNLIAQVESLSKQIQELKMIQGPGGVCEFCGGAHPSPQCTVARIPEQVDFVRGQGNPFSGTYNPGWRNHPNFSWSNQRQPPQGLHPPQQPPPMQEKKYDLENTFSKFMTSTDARFKDMDTQMKNQQSTLHNLEIQLGQLTKLLSERPTGSLPSNTEVNPRGEMHPPA